MDISDYDKKRLLKKVEEKINGLSNNEIKKKITQYGSPERFLEVLIKESGDILRIYLTGRTIDHLIDSDLVHDIASDWSDSLLDLLDGIL